MTVHLIDCPHDRFSIFTSVIFRSRLDKCRKQISHITVFQFFPITFIQMLFFIKCQDAVPIINAVINARIDAIANGVCPDQIPIKWLMHHTDAVYIRQHAIAKLHILKPNAFFETQVFKQRTPIKLIPCGRIKRDHMRLNRFFPYRSCSTWQEQAIALPLRIS